VKSSVPELQAKVPNFCNQETSATSSNDNERSVKMVEKEEKIKKGRGEILGFKEKHRIWVFCC